MKESLEEKQQVNIESSISSSESGKPPKKDNIVGNIILNTIYHILVLIVPFITTPYISRVLQPSGVGIYSYTQSFVVYFTMFAALGTVSYGTREIARRRDDKKELSKAFWEIELITIFMALLSIGGWIILFSIYKSYQNYLILWVFSIVAVIFDISWLYAGIEKFKYTILINLFFKILSCILVFVMVKSKNDVNIYIMISSISILLGNISMWFFLPIVLVKCKPEFATFKYHFKETIIYFIPTIATTIYTVLDKTLIGLITENNDYNGQYESATKIINICKTIGFISIVGVVTSRSSYLFKINDEKLIKKTFVNTLNIVCFFTISISFGLIAISDVFVPLFFGDGYTLTIKMINVMAPLVFIICFSNICGGLYYTPSGKRGQSSIYLIIGSVINLILNIILINIIGPIGACISTLIAEFIISFLYIAYCKIITWEQIFIVIWKKIVAGTVMLVFIYFVGKNIFSNPYFDLVFRILSGAFVYMLTLLLLKDKILIDMFRKVKR